MADLATLQTRLDEAETALHKLMTGTSTVSLRSANGSMVTYGTAEAAALQSYVVSLKSQVASASGSSSRRRVILTSF